MPDPLILRNIKVRGRRTSMKLDLSLWDALGDICEREEMDMDELCTWLDSVRGESSLTSAVRVFLVSYFRACAQEAELSHRAVASVMTPMAMAGRELIGPGILRFDA